MTNKPPVNAKNYNTYLWQLEPDKTGTIYQTLVGNLGANTPWGVRIWRCPPNQPIQLIYFLEGGNGRLSVDHMNKQLLFLGTDADRNPFWFVVAGYIYPSDCPDTTVVNVNESQLASVRQSIATTQTMAQTSLSVANDAKTIANNAQARITNLEKEVNDLRTQIVSMQSQINSLLTPNQVADLVWQKIKDINYLYRMAFNIWPAKSPDQDINSYVVDLVSLIRRVK